MPSSSVAAALGGVLLVQFLPEALPWLPRGARAAWCWDAQPPTCKAPVVASGSCEEGEKIPAGGVCTATCADGKVVSGACKLFCPATRTDTPSCTGDYQDETWWDLCLIGPAANKCGENQQIELGTPEWERFGTFQCVDPSSAAGDCTNSTLPTTSLDDPGPRKDAGTIGVLVGYLAVLGVAAALVRRPVQGALLKLFHPHWEGWTLANVLAVTAVAVGLVLFLVPLAAQGGSGLETVFVTGLSTGLLAVLPMIWAFFSVGVHDLARISREAAWRIHSAFGFLFLIFGTFHGIVAFLEVEDVLLNTWFLLGFLGLLTMWIGVLPSMVYSFLPDKLRYDKFKIVHLLTPVGYAMAVVHILDHAIKFQSIRAILITAVNALVLIAWAIQFAKRRGAAPEVAVRARWVLEDSEDRHTCLSLYIPGFSFEAGQWAHVEVPSIGFVSHPFTLVPVPGVIDRGHFQFIMKEEGEFTRAMRLMAATNDMKVRGPFGLPPTMPKADDAVIFVVGGVGVTPALSLVPEARTERGAERVRFFWNVRSPELLKKCAPFLEPHLKLDEQCVRVKVPPEADSSGKLPLDAKEGHGDVAEFLGIVSGDLRSLGVRSATLFLCGNPRLISAAKAAVAGAAGQGIEWQVHQEAFNFLPKLGKSRPQGPKKVLAGAQVGASSGS